MKKAFLTIAVCLSAMLMSADFSFAQGGKLGGRLLGRLSGGLGGGLGGGISSGLGGLSGGIGGGNLISNHFNPGFTGAIGAVGQDGMVQTVPGANHNCQAAVKRALNDPFSPEPFYAYSEAGIDAGHTHQWNQQQQYSTPWHGNYNYWKYQSPTALVVPPTAAFQTNYRWGVAQTTSTPINHQFGGGGGGGIIGGGAGFQNTPEWPWSTNQFGVYSVRGPWGR